MSKLKIAIITGISGLSNTLINPEIIFNNIDYHAFVDNIIPNSIWNQHKVQQFTLDKTFKGRRNCKIYKILPHLFLPNYDYYIWVDSTNEVKIDPHEILKNINYPDIALWKHPKRCCVYDEGENLLQYKNKKWDYHQLITEQLQYYTSKKYPKNNGLYENKSFVLKNTPDINTMCLTWWELLCKYSSRDQMSLPYAMYEKNIQPALLTRGPWGKTARNNMIMPQVRSRRYHNNE